MTTRIPLTAKGAEKLREELNRLKKKDRPRIVAAIAEARAHGDLKENAEYHAAKDEQGFSEGRINQLESALSHAEIIDVASVHAQDRVVFGATVDLVDVDTRDKVRYQIVGDLEADISQGRVSISSPVARALIGQSQGEIVEVKAPGGDRCLEIVGIGYE